MTKPRLTFLIADDDKEVINILKEELEHTYKGCLVFFAFNGAEALQKVQISPPTCLIVDINLPRMDGAQVIDNIIKTRQTEYPIICITGLDANDSVLNKIKKNNIPIMHKPFKISELMQLIKKSLITYLKQSAAS